MESAYAMALNTPCSNPNFPTKVFCDTMIKYFSAGTNIVGLGYLIT